MLEKLISNLKNSLPEPLRKMVGGKEAHDDESSEYSEEVSEESHDTSDNSGAEDKKKKQISMIIRVVVVIGLGYLAVTEFVLNNNQDNEVPTVAVKSRRPKKPLPKPGETKKQEQKTIETSAKVDEQLATTPVSTAEVKPAPETVAPIESINIADKKIEEIPPTEKPVEELSVVQTPPTEIPPAPQIGEVKESQKDVDKTIDNLIDTVDQTDKTKEEISTKKEVNLEDKIVADDVYTPPPAYDQLGRGLVYNCKEKYWACLDKTSYVACNKNMKWNKANGKPLECVVQNVYGSDDDCGVVQKYNVSTNKDTKFCK